MIWLKHALRKIRHQSDTKIILISIWMKITKLLNYFICIFCESSLRCKQSIGQWLLSIDMFSQ